MSDVRKQVSRGSAYSERIVAVVDLIVGHVCKSTNVTVCMLLYQESWAINPSITILNRHLAS